MESQADNTQCCDLCCGDWQLVMPVIVWRSVRTIAIPNQFQLKRCNLLIGPADTASFINCLTPSIQNYRSTELHIRSNYLVTLDSMPVAVLNEDFHYYGGRKLVSLKEITQYVTDEDLQPSVWTK